MASKIVYDYYLGRQLLHDHGVWTSSLYLLKAGDTATGTIVLPITPAQGNALINSINAGTTTISNQRVNSWRRFHMMMGG